MSVYISGVEMPVTCCHCPLMGYDPEIEWNDGGRETQGAYICVMTKELIDNTKRENHCPLVPVPEHGRLGDLDKIENEIAQLSPEGYTTGGIRLIIDCAPTIIPADKEVEG